jgi:hypothetical protein
MYRKFSGIVFQLPCTLLKLKAAEDFYIRFARRNIRVVLWTTRVVLWTIRLLFSGPFVLLAGLPVLFAGLSVLFAGLFVSGESCKQ